MKYGVSINQAINQSTNQCVKWDAYFDPDSTQPQHQIETETLQTDSVFFLSSIGCLIIIMHSLTS